MSTADGNAAPAAEENSGPPREQGVHEAARREKLKKVADLGVDPWGGRFDDRALIGDARALESTIETSTDDEGATAERGPRVRVAGRVMLRRKAGKLFFLDLQDWTGRVQIFLGKKQVDEQSWELAQCLDLGDLVGVDGELKHTKAGELTVFAERLHFLSKAIEPPPDKHSGLGDVETRQRNRHLDLVHTPGSLERFLNRTKIVASIRATLGGEGFVEVEGPTLHTIAGGAAAKPFTTHHNALDMQLYLRIALELHLKRLLVGGVERVYELGRVYRNEGISPRHNPEFTMLEVYQAYGDYRSMMDLTEKMIVDAIEATGQPHQLPFGDATVDFSPPFARKTYDELFEEHVGVDPADEASVADAARRLQIEVADRHPDVVKSDVFEEQVEDRLTGPVFVLDYPACICPLTKRKRGDDSVAERFELFVQGMEIANAYTELNDPDLQEALFRTQLSGLADDDSMARMDQDFIHAMRAGMPPAGGLGVGIDRLTMLLTNCRSIRDVILFPIFKPETG